MTDKKCDECRGACCELLIMRVGNSAHWELLLARGIVVHGEEAFVPSRCRHLTADGLCEIQETKPEPCRNAGVGARVCQACVRVQRPALAEKWEWK